MPHIFISFDDEVFFMLTGANYTECYFKYFEQCINKNMRAGSRCVMINSVHAETLHDLSVQVTLTVREVILCEENKVKCLIDRTHRKKVHRLRSVYCLLVYMYKTRT